MKKNLLMTTFVFLLSFFIKGLFINKIPNSISLQEIDLLHIFNVAPAVNDFSFRFVSVVVTSMMTVLLFNLIFLKTKNILLSLSASVVTIVSPWIIILSRTLNLHIFVLLIVVGMIFFIKNRKVRIFTIIFLLVLIRLVFINNNFLSIKFESILPSLISLFDLRTIFFHGDPLSPMLRIPLTGYFLYIDLFMFFCGIYYLFLSNQEKKLTTTMLDLLYLGLFFFIIVPSDIIMTVRSELVLLWINIIIGFGYYYIIIFLKKVNVLFLLTFILIVFTNTAFYAESLINHFDKMNSVEWGYAEQATSKYLINNDKKQIYFSPSSDKAKRFLTFFEHDKKEYLTLQLNQLSKTCFGSNVICVLTEFDLNFINFNKNLLKINFGNDSGLPIYFIYPNQ